MTDEKMQKEASNRPEQTKPEQEHRGAPQPQANAAAQLGHRVTPGRRPLFRTEVVSGRS